jgi:hypothetical protein
METLLALRGAAAERRRKAFKQTLAPCTRALQSDNLGKEAPVLPAMPGTLFDVRERLGHFGRSPLHALCREIQKFGQSGKS